MNNEFLQWAIGVSVVPMAVSAAARFIPKEKIVGWLKPRFTKIGEVISKFLILRLGKNSAERVEEGIICTLLHSIGWAALYIEDGLLADNQTKKGPENDTGKKEEHN